MGDFIIQQIRGMLWFFDNIIYGLIDDVYGILLQITRTTLFDQELINSFAMRIYAFIGIFMLFKVSISFLTYVLNPDSLTDKEKGFSSVFKRIILSLIMVVLVPYIFSEAYNLQSIILEENTIMNVIFGSPSDRDVDIAGSNSTYAESAGQKIQFTVLFAFTQPNYEEFYQDNKYDLSSCKNVYATDLDGNYQFRKTPSFDDKEASDSAFIYALNENCFGTYNPDTDTYEQSGQNGTLYQAFSANDLETAYQNYAQGIAQQSFDLFFRKEVVLAKDASSGRYLVNYKAGISTAVGIGVLYLFLMFCIDIAVRSIKLGFLQMIAPIPILSYCDPKSGKDGMFSKWFKMCKNTYLDLFIRLAALYLGIYIISLIGTFKDMVTGETVSNWIVNVFMVIGVLIFIKKLPEILKESLGLDGGTFKDFKLNPLKRIEADAIGGKQIAAVGNKAVGAGLGLGAGALAMGAGVLTGQGLRLGALGKGLAGGFKGDKFGKNFSSSYGAARARKKELDQMRDDGVNPYEIGLEKFKNIFRGQTPAQHIKAVSDGLKAMQTDYDSYTKTVAGVDKIAKEMDKRKQAAEAAGQYAESKRWADAFDARVKEIAANGGKLATRVSSTLDLEAMVGADGSYTAGDFDTHITESETNAALVNIVSHMEGLAKELNRQGANVDGYQEVPEDIASDIKLARNKALSSQQSVDTNASTRKANDMDKYTGGKKN